jgi:hypothetical protein
MSAVTRHNQNNVMNTNACEDIILPADSQQAEKSIHCSSSFCLNHDLQHQQGLQEKICHFIAGAKVSRF